MNVATVLAIAFAGLLILRTPVIAMVFAHRSRVGRPAVSPSEMALDADGAPRPLISRDSATFLFFLDAACEACRLDARSYVEFAKWAAQQRAATRLLLPNNLRASAQFGRLAGDVNDVRITTDRFFEGLGVLAWPSLILVDRTGTIHGRWIGVGIPEHLEALNALHNVR
jgi:hypothetical protein